MYRVVIADDEPLIIDGLRETIEWDELGLEIAGEASNGVEALAMIQAVKPKILITDVKMPVMDGLLVIKQIRRLNLPIKVIVISGYSDYEFLKQAIEFGVESYLLKPINNHELIQILQNTIQQVEQGIHSEIVRRQGMEELRVSTLKRLLSNHISVKEYEEKKGFLMLPEENGTYEIALGRIDQIEIDAADAYAMHLKMYSVLNICNEIVQTKVNGTVFEDSNGYIVFFIQRSRLEFVSERQSMFNEIISSVRHFLKLQFTIGIGCMVDSVFDLRESYLDAIKCLEYSLLSSSRNIWISEEIDPFPNDNMLLTFNFEALKTLIKQGEKLDILQLITNFFGDLSQKKYISTERIREIVVHIVVIMNHTLREFRTETDSWVVDSHYNIAKILSLNRLSDFEEWLKDFCEHVFAIMPSSRPRTMSTVVSQTIAYIKQQYNEDISLKLASAQVMLHPAYLGQLFKRETGESFTDYVNQFRIIRAKELLISTNLKVYEICEKVGFTNYQYFIKIFKKHTGINPTDIKKGHGVL
ncbi:response regulator [Cohnella sp. REN36]|uniref:response regulator n=1 Tax=Cohnella sp. REN36 TaxID=2887347 RepID=UPI001D13B75B|nr:response regulator [Cohnella sp. REN36]MCC3372440.1 response regulator [Cohnella sp. REN36]